MGLKLDSERMMQAKTFNYSKMRLLYLQSSSHETSLDTFVPRIDTYSSGIAIASILHRKSYDILVLDMDHVESMEVLESIKRFLPQRYVIVCGNKGDKIVEALHHGADSVLLDPSDPKACEAVLYKAASYLNMQEIFEETYYTDRLTSCQNLYALQEKIAFSHDKVLVKVALHSFKAFQIYYGGEIADKVLVEFGDAIKINLPVNAELFRTNEDEFAILLNNPAPSQEKILSKQLKAFFEQTPIEVDGFLLKIHTDIGIASGTKLIEKSDIALSEAKHGSRIATYDKGSLFIKEQMEHIRWVKVIQETISEDRIKVYYQPIMDNKSGIINKYEVLCRIEDSDKVLYQPNDFIPSAIVAGRMCDITRVVIDKSFKNFQNSDYAFSINITREDFMADYLVDYISYKCDVYGIDPKRIYIEVLENISTEAATGYCTQIKGLKELGCNISIDDFGIDSSNFSRMMQIDAEVLKIDGHFIQKLLSDDNAKIIVENIVDFSQKIGAKTVAEYVDSKELHELVTQMGISYSQGYYIGEPSPMT